MTQLKIDYNLCAKCGTCAEVCPTKVFDFGTSGPIEARSNLCIECGHCVAVCRTSAILHLKMVAEFFPLKPLKVSFAELLSLMQHRRSIRNYQPLPVEQNIIIKLLEGAKCAPTGSNAQEINYLVVADPKRLDLIRHTFIKLFSGKFRCGFLALFFGRKKIKLLQAMAAQIKEGNDLFLRQTPILLIMYVKKKTPMRYLDAGIAGHAINLLAETYGLGACWIGFHTILCKFFPSMRHASLVPVGCEVVGSMALGYPAIKYYKTCSRKSLQVIRA